MPVVYFRFPILCFELALILYILTIFMLNFHSDSFYFCAVLFSMVRKNIENHWVSGSFNGFWEDFFPLPPFLLSMSRPPGTQCEARKRVVNFRSFRLVCVLEGWEFPKNIGRLNACSCTRTKTRQNTPFIAYLTSLVLQVGEEASVGSEDLWQGLSPQQHWGNE